MDDEAAYIVIGFKGLGNNMMPCPDPFALWLSPQLPMHSADLARSLKTSPPSQPDRIVDCQIHFHGS